MAKHIILLSLLLATAVSCNDKANQATAHHQTLDGGTDTGGSNDYMGKPMESYIIDVRSLPEFKVVIDPILQKLDQKFPRLSTLMYVALQSRTWYLIPGELKNIPNQTISVPFAKQTDQFALHSEKSIWISQDKRNDYLTAHNQAELGTHILHEIIMALKVDGKSRARKVAPSDFLTQTEYDEIRSLVDLLINKLDTITESELNVFLRESQFYTASKTLDLIQSHPMIKVPFGNLLRDEDGANVQGIYMIVDQHKSNKSLMIDNKIAGNSDPKFESDKGKSANFCTYDLEPLKSLSVKTFNPSGKTLINTKSGRSDKWTGSLHIDFQENIKYKNFKDGRTSAQFIGGQTIVDGIPQAKLAHIYYYQDQIVFFEIYNVTKNKSGWVPSGLSDFYVFCLNRNLDNEE